MSSRWLVVGKDPLLPEAVIEELKRGANVQLKYSQSETWIAIMRESDYDFSSRSDMIFGNILEDLQAAKKVGFELFSRLAARFALTREK